MKLLTIIQTVIAVALMAVILLQNKGAGAGSVFGGGDSSNVFSTKRGLEKTLFRATIALATAFIGLALANIIWQ
ncbi:preprotein translocase subunit SecG [Candidatus Falkowbacteria bacterium CG10_big_fil_rev_8_21_14_0_10_43_11]|uniref:Protein-export membrane protein SecG n=1 Tax=Candidatus Falkowbacteria bacterium CG10_big_fil_rev_8_21_14_0_10_43_11 TaxID=1974568 RepID=A0A2M6WL59_9BACT|nr:MAG: preprotein translocase subunit SecG [Candidatus Falkowbacteria bacterium CG10_big_fil_rev_8_21_14_0_10_43_11]